MALYTVGVSIRDSDSLRFVYEGHKKFAALPTLGILLSSKSFNRNESLYRWIARMEISPLFKGIIYHSY